MGTQKFTITLPEALKQRNTLHQSVYHSSKKVSAKLMLKMDKTEKKSWEIISISAELTRK